MNEPSGLDAPRADCARKRVRLHRQDPRIKNDLDVTEYLLAALSPEAQGGGERREEGGDKETNVDVMEYLWRPSWADRPVRLETTSDPRGGRLANRSANIINDLSMPRHSP